jgi:hypothetical protein
MREFIDICALMEARFDAYHGTTASDLVAIMDARSIAAIFEVDYDTDEKELAEMWMESCQQLYNRIKQQGYADLYRQIMVLNFKSFCKSLKDGRNVGNHWSVNSYIESPTWKQDQTGDIPVMIEGRINATQIDWDATLKQNFEWPHEGEIIFKGEILVEQVSNQDTDQIIKIQRRLPK